MIDWQEVTALDSLEIWMIDKAKRYQERLRILVLEYIGRNVILEEIDVARGHRTIPFAEYINAIERNLKNLVGTDVPEHMVSTVTWHGELLDDRRLDYTDVNRWFNIMYLLRNLLETFSRRFITTAKFYSGVCPDFQMLGIG